MNFLLELGASINFTDSKGRNALHYSLNYSTVTLDSNFDIEKFLLENAIDINRRDVYQRPPLHYLFVKFDKEDIDESIDPIEAITSLLVHPDLEVIVDKFKKNKSIGEI